MVTQGYGARVLQFGSGDSILAIESKRTTLRQRPVSVSASLIALPVPAQQNSGTRLLVYRGAITTEVSHISALGTNWEVLFGMNRVFFDVWFGPAQPFVFDFTHWPDEVCRVEPGEALGAGIILPVDMTTGAEMHGSVVLSFSGTDVPDTSETASGGIPDVRNLKAV